MKKLLALFLVSTLFVGCTCKDGYGPNDCDVAWADHYVDTWAGTVTCSGSSYDVSYDLTKLSTKRVSFEGAFYFELDDWNVIFVPSQSVTTNAGSGTAVGTGNLQSINVSSGGVQVSAPNKLVISVTSTVNGTASTCSYDLRRQ